jgi:hypothetical protein
MFTVIIIFLDTWRVHISDLCDIIAIFVRFSLYAGYREHHGL